MKHVFSVHSPITFLAAHAVIEQLDLPLEDVIILTNGYTIPTKKYNTFPFLSNINNRWYKKLLNLNHPVLQDQYLERLLKGDDFTAYLDLMSYHQRELITHTKCRGFHFIEEGNSSYRDRDDLEDLTWDKRTQAYRISGFSSRLKEAFLALKWVLRGYSHRLLSIPYSFSAYAHFVDTTFYCFSDLAFPTIPDAKKKILRLNPSQELDALAGGQKISDAIIWVDGSNSRFTGLPESYYQKAIDNAIRLLGERLHQHVVYVKLRPGLTDYSSNYLYQQLVNNGCEVRVLPDKLILECLFLNSDNCDVIGNLSSALFYASVFGHRAFSIYSLYEKEVPTIFDNMPGYWSKVEKL